MQSSARSSYLFFSGGALSYIVSIAANSIAANSSEATFTPHVSLLAVAATAAASFFFYIFLIFSLMKYTQRKTKDYQEQEDNENKEGVECLS